MVELYGPFSQRVCDAAAAPVGWLARLVLDLEITGRENLPVGSGAVIAANHLSHIDPPVVSISVGANVRYLALDELYGRSRFFDALTLFTGAIPMSRERPPLGAMRTALAHLGDHGLVGLFPEGRRVERWGDAAPKRGAAWLAVRTGLPLVPVAIAGTEGTLSLSEPSVHRVAVRAWIEPPILAETFAGSPDRLGDMMEEWRLALDRRLAPWPAARSGAVG